MFLFLLLYLKNVTERQFYIRKKGMQNKYFSPIKTQKSKNQKKKNAQKK